MSTRLAANVRLLIAVLAVQGLIGLTGAGKGFAQQGNRAQSSPNQGSSNLFGPSSLFGGSAAEEHGKAMQNCIGEERKRRLQIGSKAGHYAKISKQEEMEIMQLCQAMHPEPAQKQN